MGIVNLISPGISRHIIPGLGLEKIPQIPGIRDRDFPGLQPYLAVNECITLLFLLGAMESSVKSLASLMGFMGFARTHSYIPVNPFLDFVIDSDGIQGVRANPFLHFVIDIRPVVLNLY